MILNAVILSLLAGLAIPAGALLAHSQIFERHWGREEVRHGIIGLGAGALVAAVALVLVPEGVHKYHNIATVFSFVGGGVVFMFCDKALDRKGGRFSQFLAMMLDFVPEAIVLGALITESFAKAVFLAVIMAAQNLPEGYASYLEMTQSKTSRKRLLCMFTVVGLTGPLYILLGTGVFVNMETVLALMMTFCAGGILYLVFKDIAPRVSYKNHWLPPLGTVLGFTIGLIGYLYT